jgi:hypothetical protein
MLIPDPSPPVTPTGNISTLRLNSYPVDDGWTVIQDYRRYSILNGFSGVGGLWTFLSGIYAAVFGCSILRVLRGNSLCPSVVFG